jgi:hypothetical protein
MNCFIFEVIHIDESKSNIFSEVENYFKIVGGYFHEGIFMIFMGYFHEGIFMILMKYFQSPLE